MRSLHACMAMAHHSPEASSPPCLSFSPPQTHPSLRLTSPPCLSFSPPQTHPSLRLTSRTACASPQAPVETDCRMQREQHCEHISLLRELPLK